jgi:hypothetical protein
LPFLSLPDLVQLVHCGQRFNHIARKERSRGLVLKGSAKIAPVASSSLSHHVTSLHLERRLLNDVPLSRGTLQQLRHLPRLTSLQLTLRDDDAVDHFMQGLSWDDARAALRAVVPLHLRSFCVAGGALFEPLGEEPAFLVSFFWTAVPAMTQLTELNIELHSRYIHRWPELAHLPHLRKLTLGPVGEWGEFAAELKQLSQLRELTFLEDRPMRLRRLCQPPHALQLESLTFSSMELDEETMLALLHLPTLTALHPGRISSESDAWALLPQLPCLRCFSFSSYSWLTPTQLSSLCTAFSHCSSLVDLTIAQLSFKAEEGEQLTIEKERANWTALLSSVPHLRRLSIDGSMDSLLAVLPLHLPLLDHLMLTLDGGGFFGVDSFASMAHPNVRLLEFDGSNKRPVSDEQLRACLHNNEHFPKLERCIHAQPAGSRLIACLVRALQGDETRRLDGPPRL